MLISAAVAYNVSEAMPTLRVQDGFFGLHNFNTNQSSEEIDSVSITKNGNVLFAHKGNLISTQLESFD